MTKHELILANKGIAIKVVNVLKIKGQSYEDAMAEAMLLLTLAAESYNPNCGTKFSTWAWLKIEGGMKNWLRKETRLNKLSSATCEDTDNYPLQSSDDPHTNTYDREVSSIISESLEKMSTTHKHVASLHTLGDHTILDTVDKLNVGRDIVIRRHKDVKVTLLATYRQEIK